jgi:hypothetical protein
MMDGRVVAPAAFHSHHSLAAAADGGTVFAAAGSASPTRLRRGGAGIKREDDENDDDDADENGLVSPGGESGSARKKQKRNKPTLSCFECVERKTKASDDELDRPRTQCPTVSPKRLRRRRATLYNDNHIPRLMHLPFSSCDGLCFGRDWRSFVKRGESMKYCCFRVI